MTEKFEKGISRRAFIKGTAAGAGIIAATGRGLIGKTADQVHAATQADKYSFETPLPAVPANDIKQTITADVVVVGLGMAGVPAALSAAEAGVKVVALEKQDRVNVLGVMDLGMMGTRWQKTQGMTWNPAVINEAIRELIKWGANRIDQRLLRIWVNHGLEYWDWLTAMTDPADINWQPSNWPPPEPWDNSRENYKQYPTAAHLSMSDFTRVLNIMAGKAGAAGMLVVMGGLLCNADLQAYDADFNVIKELYLAGNTVGRRFAVSYPTTCPGISNGLAFTHGRYAALKAAADNGG